MKAVIIHQYGDANTLSYEDVDQPTPGAGEVLVKVHATSVNPVDAVVRAGYMQEMIPLELPLALGIDVAGTVEAVGEGVSNFAVGDAVYGYSNLARQGAYAEYAILSASELATKPSSIDFNTAASVPLAAVTAWQALFDVGGLQPGQAVLIHGAGGGVGTFAVQLAVAKGARVFATASSDKLDMLRELGAADAINYKGTRFEEAVDNVDVVIDLVGGLQERSMTILNPGGSYVSLKGQPDAEMADAQNLRAIGMMTQPSAAQLAEIAGMIDTGQVMPQVSSVLPLEQAQQAHEQIEEGHTRGKIVLQVVEA